VHLVSFGLDRRSAEFPFAPKVFGAAAAESIAQGQIDALVWLDSDSLVLREPSDCRLPECVDLGFRPVDHTLIGSRIDSEVDGFWSLIYSKTGVDPDRLFTMTTTVDRVAIRPYFNAGLVVVRPELGLLRAWRARLADLIADHAFEEFYEASILYRFFLHQAALAGTVLASVDAARMRELPLRYAYPLHMHRSYPPQDQLAALNDAITCRYDVFFEDGGWREVIPIRGPLHSWLGRELAGPSLAARE
jgi:hypothetical protein